MEGLDIVEAVAVIRSRGLHITAEDLIEEIDKGALKADRVNGEYFFKLSPFADWFKAKVGKKRK